MRQELDVEDRLEMPLRLTSKCWNLFGVMGKLKKMESRALILAIQVTGQDSRSIGDLMVLRDNLEAQVFGCLTQMSLCVFYHCCLMLCFGYLYL